MPCSIVFFVKTKHEGWSGKVTQGFTSALCPVLALQSAEVSSPCFLDMQGSKYSRHLRCIKNNNKKNPIGTHLNVISLDKLLKTFLMVLFLFHVIVEVKSFLYIFEGAYF